MPDGRKWRQSARTRAAVLLHLSTFANGDGSFERDGKNFSPSCKRLEKQYAPATLYRVLGELQELNLLDWSRPNHSGRRIYRIKMENFSIEHLPYSHDNTSHIRASTSHIQTEHLSPAVGDPQITPLTSEGKAPLTSEVVPSLGSQSFESKSYRQDIHQNPGAKIAPDSFEQFFSTRTATPEPTPAPTRVLEIEPAPKPKPLFSETEWYDFYLPVCRHVEGLPKYRHISSIRFGPLTHQIFLSIRRADPSAPVPDVQTLCDALDKAIADAKVAKNA